MINRRKEWLNHEKKRQNGQRKYRKIIEKALNEDVINQLQSNDAEQVIKLFKSNNGIKKTFSQIVTLYKEIVPKFAGREYGKFKSYTFNTKSIDDIWDIYVDGYIEKIAERKLIELNQSTANMLERQVVRARRAGLGEFEAAKFIERNMKNMSRTRAVTIFRTESVAASNFGSKKGAYTTGLDLKENWLSTPDSRTRDGDFDHVAADGQEANEAGEFTVSGEKMDFPGDTSFGASAGNIINCRCTNIFETY